jgi:hypothetical protein
MRRYYPHAFANSILLFQVHTFRMNQKSGWAPPIDGCFPSVRPQDNLLKRNLLSAPHHPFQPMNRHARLTDRAFHPILIVTLADCCFKWMPRRGLARIRSACRALPAQFTPKWRGRCYPRVRNVLAFRQIPSAFFSAKVRASPADITCGSELDHPVRCAVHCRCGAKCAPQQN